MTNLTPQSELTEEEIKALEAAVKLVVEEYGETLKLLGEEKCKN